MPNYLSHVQKRLNEEGERLLHYMDQSTRLVRVVEGVWCGLSMLVIKDWQQSEDMYDLKTES